MPEAETNGGWRPKRPQLLAAGLVAVVVAVVVVVILLVSGGSDDDNSGGTEGNTGGAFPPNVVKDSEIEAEEEGTPERALLEWWQAFQFQDVATVEALTSRDTLDAIGENDLEELVEVRGQGLQGIEVLGASEDGDTASIRVGLLTFQAEEGQPPPTEPTASTPATFAMREEGGEWLFDQTEYLRAMVEELAAAQEQAQQEQPEEEQSESE